jgi:hypothetical protein
MISVGNSVFMPRTDAMTSGLRTLTKAQPVCDLCGSKIYPGDTVYTLDRQTFCEDCVEVSEYETCGA